MKVLVACEFSGIVRDAFRRLGHDAISCDLLPTERPGPHIQGDVTEILDDGYDLMIAHPPCTYLAHSGSRWLTERPERYRDLIDGAIFFRRLLDAPIPKICVENPVMNGYAVKIVGRTYNQIIQPWQFGHVERRGTGLWLRGLGALVETHNVRAALAGLPRRETDRIHWAGPTDRARERSRTLPGIAAAMAEQWAGPVAPAVPPVGWLSQASQAFPRNVRPVDEN